MMPGVKTEPWPGTDYGWLGSISKGTGIGEGKLHTDSRTAFIVGRDYDVGSCCDLPRLDSRGTCRNPGCHHKGVESNREASIEPELVGLEGRGGNAPPRRDSLQEGKGLERQNSSPAGQPVILQES